MGTGQQKTSIYLKKFLTKQQITDNFLDYLHNLILESHTKTIPNSGIYTYPVTGLSSVVNTIDLLTPGEVTVADGGGPVLEADDGHGRILTLDDADRTQVPVPNELGVKYFVGLKFNDYPVETEINVRTGKIKWGLTQEAIGERGEPNFVSYYSNQLTIQVDNVCSGALQSGRSVRVWLKEPASIATGDSFEVATIIPQSITFDHDGGANYLDVPNEFAGYFSIGQSLTIDKSPTSPLTTTVSNVGATDSGGSGYTRIFTANDLSSYTVANGAFVSTGINVINLTGTLGQGATPSIDPTDYEVFLLGVTVTETDLRYEEYYAYLLSYIGTGSGNNPSSFDFSDQVQIPENLSSISSDFQNFKRYQIQRNAIGLRGGGQFSFNSGVLTWNEDFEITNPFRGIYSIGANTISSIVNDNVLYTKIYKEQQVVVNGNASGEIWIEDTTDFNNGDEVVISDNDSNRITGFVNGAPGIEKLTIVDGLLAPIDLSAFTTLKGAWVQRKNLTLSKGTINEGDLKPEILGDLNEDVLVIAVAHNGILVFKNGVLKLEDGDIGEISNLPNSFNWINNNTELTDSVTRSAENSIGILAPKNYGLTATLPYYKNFSLVSFTNETLISGNLATPLVEIKYDSSTSDNEMKVVLKDITLQNLGAGHVIQIDNDGATKPMHIVFDGCLLLGNGGLAINVVQTNPLQPIKIDILDSKSRIFQGGIVFPTANNNDELNINDIKFAPTNSITFGDAATNPSSNMRMVNVLIDKIIALGTGNLKTIEVLDSYSWEYHKRIDIDGQTLATFKISQIIVDSNDYNNHQKAINGTVFRGGGFVDFTGGTLSWTLPFEIFNPYYGISLINAGSLAAIANNEVIYTKVFPHRYLKQDGNASGEAVVEYPTDFNDNDQVIFGDENTVLGTGYVFGAPVGETITVDDGAGTPIDLSSLQYANGAWIKRVNLSIYKSALNVGDLLPDKEGNIDQNIYIIGVRSNEFINLVNGQVIQHKWVYEESTITQSPLAIGDDIFLPADSRNGLAAVQYQIGAATIEFRVNGIKWSSTQIDIEGSFVPSYNSGTGVVSVSDAVDLSQVRIEDVFKDFDGNEFSILGDISNVLGSKQFRIATGQTVNTVGNATIFRQDFIEPGILNDLVNKITTRRKIPVNALLEFRMMPLHLAAFGGGSSGGSSGTLQDAYNGGNTITVVSGTPIVISGPAGQKLFRVLGDIEVTGVIDPKAITFSRNASTPFTGQDGLWIDNDGNLNYFNSTTEQNATVGQGSDPFVRNYINPSPTILNKGRIVTKLGAGNIQYADYNSYDLSLAIGVLLDNANQNDSKPVRLGGYVSSDYFDTSCFVEGSFPVDRSRVWLHASGKMTITPPAANSEKIQEIIGIWDDGGLNLQINFLGVA